MKEEAEKKEKEGGGAGRGEGKKGGEDRGGGGGERKVKGRSTPPSARLPVSIIDRETGAQRLCFREVIGS